MFGRTEWMLSGSYCSSVGVLSAVGQGLFASGFFAVGTK